MTFGNFYFAGGIGSLFVIGLTVLALFCSLVAVVVTLIVKNSMVPGIMGMLLIFFAILIALIGVGSGLYGRSRMERAIAGSGIDPSQEAMIRAEGEREANQPLMMGLLGAALPGLAGAALGMVAMKRRSDANALN